MLDPPEPGPAELKRSAQPPLLRPGQVSEEFTGSWAPIARAQGWGRGDALLRVLRHSDAASLLSSDPASLTLDARLVSDHEDDGPRLFLLGAMSIATIGCIPLPYHSEWLTTCDVTLRTADSRVVAEYPLQVEGAYDIWAFPLTMFTLGAAGLRGAKDGAEIRQRMASHLAADLMEQVAAD